MSDTTVVNNPNPGSRWWLPVLLALIILAVLAIAFFATHPHVFGSGATATPTATATATATTRPTVAATPKPGPTGTPKPGPTGTPKPGPTATPLPHPTSTPAASASGTPATTHTSAQGVKTGTFGHPLADIDAIQRGANRKQSQYTYYLDPFQVVKNNLSSYGFTQPFTITTPGQPPAATPTPVTNSQGLPQVAISVKYLGKVYTIYLDQPVQKGPSGIWVIITIRACTAGQTSC